MRVAALLVGVTLLGASACSDDSGDGLTTSGFVTVSNSQIGADIYVLPEGDDDGKPCRMKSSGGYGDVSEGASVSAYDSKGELVGSGRLGEGRLLQTVRKTVCGFPFEFSLDKDSPRYEFSFADRGRVPIDKAELDDVVLNLGD